MSVCTASRRCLTGKMIYSPKTPFQAPHVRQRSTNHQTPSSRKAPNLKLQGARTMEFGVWCLVLFWSLVFGAWCFLRGVWCFAQGLR